MLLVTKSFFKNFQSWVSRNKKKIKEFLINGVFLGVIIGVLSGLITPFVSSCIASSQSYNIRNEMINKVDIGVGKDFIDNMLGYPLYSKLHKIYNNETIIEDIYALDGAVLRCYFVNDKVISYFITKTNNDFNNEVIPYYFKDNIVLGKSTFVDFSEKENNLHSYLRNGSGHSFAMEHYYSGVLSNYCELYYGILDYGIAKYSNFKSVGEDSLNDRSIAVPNTIGISLTEYTDLIVEYISNYDELNLRWLYKNNK